MARLHFSALNRVEIRFRDRSMAQVDPALSGGQAFRHEVEPGLALVGTAWRVPAPKATVVLSHGVNEHIGRYGHVVSALNEAECSVVAHDHRGHGQSGGRRGWIDDFDTYVADMVDLIDRERALSPELPVVLLGHSMGGLVAARAALRAQDRLAALVLSGAALRIGGNLPAWQQRFFLRLSKYAGWLPAPPSKRGILSRDPEVERQFAADALNNRRRTRLRLARQIHLGGKDALERAHELCLPLLVMHGAGDWLTDPAGSETLVARAGSGDKTLKLWPDNRHEIFNDLDREQVIAFVVAWLRERFG